MTTMPYADALHGNAKFIEREAAERKGRADAEVARLKKKYNVADEQEAIRRYKAEYVAATAELAKLEKSSARKLSESADGTDAKLFRLYPRDYWLALK